jgi:hypothetical protein
MSDLEKLLQRGRSGNAILFCGAGLTSDCLNFDDENAIGAASSLLGQLNQELERKGKISGYRELKFAAQRFRSEFSDEALMKLLKARFQIQNISASIVDITRYPWAAIYTTNFDDGLEIACSRVGRKSLSLNNTDSPTFRPETTPIIHIHGFAKAWTSDNFKRSCILDAESYLRPDSHFVPWLQKLREDIERADIVVFVGFSASDFHLERVFFNVSDLHRKAFFINKISDSINVDEHEKQERFGIPLYIGREQFAQTITDVLALKAPQEPSLASFSRFTSYKRSASLPSVSDIEDLFVWGDVREEFLTRDYEIEKPDYHVLRHEVSEIRDYLKEIGRIAFISGEICEGKSLIKLGVMHSLYVGRPIFEMRHAYEDLIAEASSILTHYPNAVLVIENCFTVNQSRLIGVARQIGNSQGCLILTARSIASEAEKNRLQELLKISAVKQFPVGRLKSDEVRSLIVLIDQVAGWREFHSLSDNAKTEFVEKTCQGFLPRVLLQLLKSPYVQKKYAEEFQKISHLEPRKRLMIIAALYISNIGVEPPVSFLSDVFEEDFELTLREIARFSGSLKLMQTVGGNVRSVPGLGTRNLLKFIIPKNEIVNAVILVLEKISEYDRRSDFAQYIFWQLLRFSIINTVVDSPTEVNRLFDHTSKIDQYRTMPLFWLQWHMAMCAQDRWQEAEKYLQMGYRTADAFERRRGIQFNRRQIDDRKAKFLATRSVAQNRSGVSLFNDLKEALDIASRLFNESELTHHPFETIVDISNALRKGEQTLSSELQNLLRRQIDLVKNTAARKINDVVDGYQRNKALEAVHALEVILR